ncbi:hypothetical protein [Bacteroides cellulosilyticus]|uniref:hypothetical protein n=1 Tax=Bacteroides cellulosilyticus TaxID=246787 RepID=UPI001C37B1D6|nr:hypothetical protein [Bacteroides cellulosilyticus]MBV3635013.1 hypothetical protein [Bacteroides cellulosilyticus]MBV3661331.1 hypothetical protein [Bacteroides cellulosilyticus]MBV3683405.1 hypothetical protein [Bacteroides cellulosilyticus]MBV3692395.1 hypothetical protein [Bacteroides cellulosilyticus]MBV3706031.1 hypothetical protein [Bacteroides cellulosilyticus]
MRDIVIIAGGIGSTYSICKSIKKEFDIRTYVIFLNETNERFFHSTKYVTEAIDWKLNSATCFLERMKEWYSLHVFDKLPILYCTSDESCVLITQYRKWFEAHFILTVPSNIIIRDYNNKELAESSAKEAGLKIPNSVIINQPCDVERVGAFLKFPVIVKPTNYQCQKIIGFKVQVCDTIEEFLLLSSNLLSQKMHFLCQEYIPGDDDKSWFYIFYRSINGKIVDCIGRKIVQHPRGKGIMAMGITCYNDELSRICHSFLKQIDYVGIGGIEFKEYAGDFFFIEMSTRSEGFIRISDIAEVSLPLITYRFTNSFEKNDELNYCQKNDRLYVDIIVYLIEIFKSRSYSGFVYLMKLCLTKKMIFNSVPFSYICHILKMIIDRAVLMNRGRR